ncbi:MAG TPA: hypothetical protein VKR52_11400 [Terracidiphilus sp.]|nr:hypothetical protein [Terracidiphilus sp.]
MSSRVVTAELPVVLFICWCLVFALSIGEFFGGAEAVAYPALLVFSFLGGLGNLILLIRKHR